MTREQAKQWLSAHVEGRKLPLEEPLREALRLAESDPELRDWWREQQQTDARLRAALQQAPVPSGLERDLLRAVGVIPAVSLRGRILPWACGLAALVVIGLSALLYLRQNEELVQDLQASVSGRTPESFESFRDGMAYFIRRVYFQLDHETDELPSIETWLNSKASPVYDELPAQLAALAPLGCKELDWQGHKVSLVCFHTREGKIVHMFIMEREGIDPGRYEDISRVAVSSGLETAGWTSANKVYLLVGSDPEVDVEFALG